jgi:hypothetical protein
MNEELKKAIQDNFKNTQLGLLRIKRNLCLGDLADIGIENHLRDIIFDTPLEAIASIGKNYYLKCKKR